MKQIAFPLLGDSSYNLDEFIESSSNKSAVNIINHWQDDWGVPPYQKFVIIQGPKSSGKTFLAKIWSYKTNALFLSQEQDIADIILSNKYFVLDNFDINWDEKQVLHIFNMLIENRGYLLMTCRSLSHIKLPDLLSRIRSLNLVKIRHPDDKMMQMLIFKLFSNHSVLIDHRVINFLIRVLPREFPVVIESIKKINEYALERKCRVTIPTIKRVLDVHIR